MSSKLLASPEKLRCQTYIGFDVEAQGAIAQGKIVKAKEEIQHELSQERAMWEDGR